MKQIAAAGGMAEVGGPGRWLRVPLWELPLQAITLLRQLPGNRLRPTCRCGVCLLGAGDLLRAEGGFPGSLAVSLQ